MGWGAVSLEISVKLQKGRAGCFPAQRRHVAGRTVCFFPQRLLSARGGCSVERIGRRRWSRDRELIEVRCCQLRTGTVGLTACIAGAASDGDRILAFVL